jgi:hypothetical protein
LKLFGTSAVPEAFLRRVPVYYSANMHYPQEFHHYFTIDMEFKVTVQAGLCTLLQRP